MKTTLAIGIATAFCFAVPGLAQTASTQLQLAQATQGGNAAGSSGAPQQQEGSGKTETRGSVRGERDGGARGRVEMPGGQEGTRVRAGVRVGIGDTVRTRTSTTRRIGVRTQVGGSDDVIIRRKKARRYVYDEPPSVVVRSKKVRRHVYAEPSVTIRRKKTRSYVYSEPSSATVVRKRRQGVSVGVGVSTRTSIRSREENNVRVRGSVSTTRDGAPGGRNTGGAPASGEVQTRSTSGSSGAQGGQPSSGGQQR